MIRRVAMATTKGCLYDENTWSQDDHRLHTYIYDLHMECCEIAHR
jgi:hypothetical protein